MASASEQRASFLARLARDVNCLSDADKHKRRRALEAVARALDALPRACSSWPRTWRGRWPRCWPTPSR